MNVFFHNVEQSFKTLICSEGAVVLQSRQLYKSRDWQICNMVKVILQSTLILFGECLVGDLNGALSLTVNHLMVLTVSIK